MRDPSGLSSANFAAALTGTTFPVPGDHKRTPRSSATRMRDPSGLNESERGMRAARDRKGRNEFTGQSRMLLQEAVATMSEAGLKTGSGSMMHDRSSAILVGSLVPSTGHTQTFPPPNSPMEEGINS